MALWYMSCQFTNQKKSIGSIQAAVSHSNSLLQLTGSTRVMKMVKIIAAKHQHFSSVVIVINEC